MSRDYQLAYSQPQTPAATDFWTQGGSAVLAPPMPAAAAAGMTTGGTGPGGPAKLSVLTRMHRLLRGRYPVAITLAAVGALAGGVLGYSMIAPRYSSVGMVQLDPRVITTSVQNLNLDNFNILMGNQVGFITSTNVAEQAMADPRYVAAYRLAYPGQPLPDDPTFIAGINVDRSRTASLIYATYSDKSKAVAEAAATAVMDAYQKLYGSDDAVRNIGQKIDYDRGRLAKMNEELDAKTREREDLVRLAGGQGELQQMAERVTEQWLTDKAALDAAVEQFQDAQSRGPSANSNESVYEQIAATNDQTMQADLAARYNAKAAMDALVARGVGPAHPAYQEAAQNLQLANKRVDDYAHEFLLRRPDAIPGSLPDSVAGMTSIDLQRKKLDRLRTKVQAEQEQSSQLGSAKQRVADVNAEIAQLMADRAQMQTMIDTLHDTQQLTKTIQVSMPTEATIQNDRRKVVGMAGFGFGGLLPLALMMLYGMRDSRFRYSDETTQADLAGVALLGILPNLPDRLSDPQQAGIAAHCVHQIRTMLQISRANDEPQVLAITSASTGDGKTSLTLALGLSYAACGARTLLVDCDLLAAGLTHRLNVTSPDGVLEAVANRALLEYVRTTDIADVAILPVGTTHAHHASTLSPVALRRLLSEAKKQFDIIIIDTGPILASIEASLICAAADRTVLAVARNQQRPLVERSIGHLQAIGANLAGVVFNRAQAKDFEKSMSGLALRSRPAAVTPPNGPTGGQVAKAVAGSFKRAG